MSLTSIVRALVASGATAEMILAVVEAEENDRAALSDSKREYERDRKRNYRLSRGQTGTDGDTPLDGFNGFPNPSLTSLISTKENTPKGVQKKSPQPKRNLPEWLPLLEWEAFKQMRLKIKKPMTDHAETLALGKLDRFRANGHDPTEILNQSVMNDYQDLYEPKEKSNANNSSSPPHGTSKWLVEGKRLADKYRADAALERGQSPSG